MLIARIYVFTVLPPTAILSWVSYREYVFTVLQLRHTQTSLFDVRAKKGGTKNEAPEEEAGPTVRQGKFRFLGPK